MWRWKLIWHGRFRNPVRWNFLHNIIHTEVTLKRSLPCATIIDVLSRTTIVLGLKTDLDVSLSVEYFLLLLSLSLAWEVPSVLSFKVLSLQANWLNSYITFKIHWPKRVRKYVFWLILCVLRCFDDWRWLGNEEGQLACKKYCHNQGIYLCLPSLSSPAFLDRNRHYWPSSNCVRSKPSNSRLRWLPRLTIRVVCSQRTTHRNNKKAKLSQRWPHNGPIYGCPEKLRESWLHPRLLFPKFVTGFCSDQC